MVYMKPSLTGLSLMKYSKEQAEKYIMYCLLTHIVHGGYKEKAIYAD